MVYFQKNYYDAIAKSDENFTFTRQQNTKSLAEKNFPAQESMRIPPQVSLY